MLNQDYALASWREAAAASDPSLYSTRRMNNGVFVWLSIAGNVGWYFPLIKEGKLTGIRSIALPRPSIEEPPNDKAALGYALKFVSPKQATKIVASAMPTQ